eukprot:gene25513-biopygen15038
MYACTTWMYHVHYVLLLAPGGGQVLYTASMTSTTVMLTLASGTCTSSRGAPGAAAGPTPPGGLRGVLSWFHCEILRCAAAALPPDALPWRGGRGSAGLWETQEPPRLQEKHSRLQVVVAAAAVLLQLAAAAAAAAAAATAAAAAACRCCWVVLVAAASGDVDLFPHHATVGCTDYVPCSWHSAVVHRPPAFLRSNQYTVRGRAE